MKSPFDARPIVVAIAGPNGAGKSTFFEAHVAPAGLRFLNADDLARELALDDAIAARLANRLRLELVEQGESFVFETVLSDPVGDKVDFLAKAGTRGYTVVLVFIGLGDASMSGQRVAMRVMQGGHDVPAGKLSSQFPRTMKNLGRAIRKLPHVLVFDNSDLADPFARSPDSKTGSRSCSTSRSLAGCRSRATADHTAPLAARNDTVRPVLRVFAPEPARHQLPSPAKQACKARRTVAPLPPRLAGPRLSSP